MPHMLRPLLSCSTGVKGQDPQPYSGSQTLPPLARQEPLLASGLTSGSQCRSLGQGCNWERLAPRQRLASSTCCLCGREEQAEEAGLAGVLKVACEMMGAKSLAEGLVTPVCLAFCTMGCGDQVPTYSLGRFLRVTAAEQGKKQWMEMNVYH